MAAASAVRLFWTTGEEARLRSLYPDTPMAALVDAFKRSESAIHARARVLGLRRSAAFLAGQHSGRWRADDDRGKATRFQPKARTQ